GASAGLHLAGDVCFDDARAWPQASAQDGCAQRVIGFLRQWTERPDRCGDHLLHWLAVMPPSTYSTWPVTKSAAGETKNVTGPTMSRGWATRPSGMRASSSPRNTGSSRYWRTRVVSTNVGATPLTVT